MTEHAESLNSQAINFASKGEFTEAIACFKRALIVENSNYLLWFNLGLTYRDAGDLQNAKECLLKAHSLEETDQDIIDALAVLCFTLGESQESLAFCEEGLDLNPCNAHFWNTRGVVYFNMSLFEEASTNFEYAVSISPYYYDALYNLRDTYEELGNKAGQEECEKKLKIAAKAGGR